MFLTREQEKILAGEYGWARSKALEVIVKVGEALGAERLIEVEHAHVSGISYTNIGDAGLELVQDFYRGRAYARVYTTINPGCVDLLSYSQIVDNRYRDKQLILNRYLEAMGFRPTYTCIPYLHRKPGPGEHLSWGESSAVIFANSLFGSRTNREGGPLALSSAITGYTYYYGLHLLENRVVEVSIAVEAKNKCYGALGLWIGYNVKSIPMIRGVSNDISGLKLMLAASAASGDHGLIVIEGVTPAKSYIVSDKVEKMYVEDRDLEEYIGVEPSENDKVLGYIGCPHLDPREFFELVDKIRSRGKSAKRDRDLLVSIPAVYSNLFIDEIHELKRYGVDVAVGTCPIVSKLREKYDYLVTNSGKAAFYMSRLHGLNTYIASIDRVLEIVFGG